jgi:hypothetical protein
MKAFKTLFCGLILSLAILPQAHADGLMDQLSSFFHSDLDHSRKTLGYLHERANSIKAIAKKSGLSNGDRVHLLRVEANSTYEVLQNSREVLSGSAYGSMKRELNTLQSHIDLLEKYYRERRELKAYAERLAIYAEAKEVLAWMNWLNILTGGLK